MMCIKHVLLYFFILPIPAASPIFLLLFTAAAFIAIKPCGYCLSLLAILFLSTSPHSPFLHPSLSSSSNSSSTTSSGSSISKFKNRTSIHDLPLNSASPNRTWLNLNGGRYSSPNLVGYEEMDKAISTTFPSSTDQNALWTRISGWDLGQSIYTTSNRVVTGNLILDRIIEPYLPPSPSPSPSPSSSPTSSAVSSHPTDPEHESRSRPWRNRELPRNYFDMSWKGIGFVVDFGMKRSVEGIKWEIEEVIGKEWARPLPEVQEVNESTTRMEADADDSAEVDKDGREAEVESGNKEFWRKVPLLGSYW
ncbi:uncharacterized protein I303_101857 [Kwoniella dejecticola CBS 10117]|uniref:Uncharacterized protein n=1 Tax=Kwoniella dejecticola CBS 10117 TaxID=1296121 RepID=A0A1A6ACK9_9TREE|nr:uncharacterized protein I303_02007 [Kwoniella dejecticola CBS 10117]OBR87794.1 hypothetical protein I303_02007 [Kwoniella dejecticola CBS 10117]